MNGSPAQIKWAQDIIDKIETAFEDLEAEYGPAPDEVRAFINSLRERQDAKELIESPLRYAGTPNSLAHYFAVYKCEADEAACEWLQIV